jgi:carbamoyl-phosphate synthase large subunit
VLKRFLAPSDSRLWRILALLRRGMPAERIRGVTGISAWFLWEFERAIALEREVRKIGARIAEPRDDEAATLLATVKRAGFGDRELAQMAGVDGRGDPIGSHGARPRAGLRDGRHVRGGVRRRDAVLLRHLRRRGSEPELPPVERPAALVIGSGPVRIGQGIEFDYCAVQAAAELRERGWQAVMINSNPETVSTDFDASSRLYFEPLDPESVRSVVEAESPDGRPLLGAFVQFGGQTPLNLAESLAAAGIPLLGANLETIDQAEDRIRFANLVEAVGIPQPEGGMARSIEEALALADRIGYPVIVRPSFVIGGLAIDFSYSPSDLVEQLARATVVDPDRPVRIDRYLEGIEVDVDAIADGETVLIPGLLEHVERAGVHSGDSVGMFPPQTVSASDQELIVAAMDRIVRALDVHGLVNAQFIVRDDGVYLIEVNPRASRTVPFMSKVTGVPMVKLAVRIALGETLREMGWGNGLLEPPPLVAVKAPAFSTAKLRGVDPSVGPGMQSTGEVIGIHTDPRVALAKAMQGAALIPPRPGADGALALISVAERDHGELPRVARRWRVPATGSRPLPEPRRSCASSATRRRSWPRSGSGRRRARAILDLIAGGSVRLVVNTPSPKSGPVRDAAEIRLAATAEGILCLTAIETAVAAAEALDPDLRTRLAEVRSLGEWVPNPGVPRGVVAAG